MPELQNVLVFVPASIDEAGRSRLLERFSFAFPKLESIKTTWNLAPFFCMFYLFFVERLSALWSPPRLGAGWCHEDPATLPVTLRPTGGSARVGGKRLVGRCGGAPRQDKYHGLLGVGKALLKKSKRVFEVFAEGTDNRY